jgi:hypothetical protein
MTWNNSEKNLKWTYRRGSEMTVEAFKDSMSFSIHESDDRETAKSLRPLLNDACCMVCSYEPWQTAHTAEKSLPQKDGIMREH